MKADEYNKIQINTGRIRDDHVTAMTRIVQKAIGVKVDGFCGPKTLEALDAHRFTFMEKLGVQGGWLVGRNVTLIPAHESWYYPKLGTGTPKAIVAHYTATNPGTALSMARKRERPYSQGKGRPASWHVSIEADGSIVQMIPFTGGAWHCSKPIEELAMGANRCSVGIELVGHGKEFTDEQVTAAAQVWRALVDTYQIDRSLAMLEHSKLDPMRRKDPGPVWMSKHAERVLDYCY